MDALMGLQRSTIVGQLVGTMKKSIFTAALWGPFSFMLEHSQAGQRY